MGGDRRNSARGTIADNDHIDLFVPMLLSMTRHSRRLLLSYRLNILPLDGEGKGRGDFNF